MEDSIRFEDAPSEFEARLLHGIGKHLADSGSMRNSPCITASLVRVADEEGNFNIEAMHGKVERVCYKIDDSSCPISQRLHDFPYETYVRMGRPEKVSVKRIFSYIPRLDE